MFNGRSEAGQKARLPGRWKLKSSQREQGPGRRIMFQPVRATWPCSRHSADSRRITPHEQGYSNSRIKTTAYTSLTNLKNKTRKDQAGPQVTTVQEKQTLILLEEATKKQLLNNVTFTGPSTQQQQITRRVKKQENMSHEEEINQSLKTDQEVATEMTELIC